MKHIKKFNEDVDNSVIKTKGYLIIYSETDEIHMNLATEEDHDKALNVIDETYSATKRVDWNKVLGCFYDLDTNGEVIKSKWIKESFTQTGNVTDWEFKDYEILGVMHIICC